MFEPMHSNTWWMDDLLLNRCMVRVRVNTCFSLSTVRFGSVRQKKKKTYITSNSVENLVLSAKPFLLPFSSLVLLRLTFFNLAKSNNTHFQCPDSTNPHLEFALYAFYVVKLGTFPPAPSGGFTPEQQQLLCHAHCISTHIITANIAT